MYATRLNKRGGVLAVDQNVKMFKGEMMLLGGVVKLAPNMN